MSARSVTLGRLVRAGVLRQRRRLTVVALVAGLTAATSTAGLWLGSTVRQAVDDPAGSGTLRQITVYADGPALTPSVVADVRRMAGVDRVDTSLEVSVGLETSGSVVTLFAVPMSGVPILDGSLPKGGLTGHQVVLPATADGTVLSDLVGRSTTVEYTERLREGLGTARHATIDVVATSDPSFQVDAPLAGYAAEPFVLRLAAARAGVADAAYLDSLGYSRLDVQAASVDRVDTVTRALQDKGFHAVSQLQRLDEVPGVLELVRAATAVLFALLLVIGVTCSLAVAHGVASERATEVATMRVFGWRSRRVSALYVAEAALVAGLAVLAGCAVGGAGAVLVGGPLRESVGDGQLGRMAAPVLPIAGSAVATVASVVLSYALVTRRVARRPIVDVFRDEL
jgi:hypothetical protein